MDIWHIILYVAGTGGGAAIGLSTNVLIAYKLRGEEAMMKMRDHEHLPLAALGALAGLAFTHAATTPPSTAQSEARYYQQEEQLRPPFDGKPAVSIRHLTS